MKKHRSLVQFFFILAAIFVCFVKINVQAADNEWQDINGHWYYYINGEPVRNSVIQIDGNYYGFDASGWMYENEGFTLYPDHNSYTYRAKPRGVLYRNEWCYAEDGYWYYFGPDGAAYERWHTIDGTLYFFDLDGKMCAATALIIDGELFQFDENGISSRVTGNGWVNLYNRWFYLENNIPFSKGKKVINGITYYFSGAMLDNARMLTEDWESYYRARPGGSLYMSEWYQDSEGAWYYYDALGREVYGLVSINGKSYYFDDWGRMTRSAWIVIDDRLYHTDSQGIVSLVETEGLYISTDGTFYVEDGTAFTGWKQIGNYLYYFEEESDHKAVINDVREINGKWYAFDLNGHMYQNRWARLNDVKADEYYYASADGSLLEGSQFVDGNWYYFSPQMQTGFVSCDGHLYFYGDDGIYVGMIQGDGWNQIGTSWYYVVDGEIVKNTDINIGGTGYSFDQSGKLKENTSDTLYIYLDSGDKIARNPGWYSRQVNGITKWFYIKPNGELARDELLNINGKEYYFDGMYLISEDTLIGDKVYRVNEDQTFKSIENADGWYLEAGKKYFFKDGFPYTGWVGDYYVDHGRMLTNKVTSDGYYVGFDGAYVRKGWILTNAEILEYDLSSWLYAKDNGKLAYNEWLKIGEDWYYFNGNSMVTGLQNIDGIRYAFSDSGVYIGRVPTDADWYEIDGKWYYLQGGYKTRDQKVRYQDALYSFDMYGKYMISDTLGYSHRLAKRTGTITHPNGEGYYESDGKRADYVGWMLIDGSWSYFLDNHRCIREGWFYENGKNYYFVDCRMLVGYYSDGYQVLHFGDDGNLIEKIHKDNGWYQAGNDWYYFKDGELVNGIETINGVDYGFSDYKLLKGGYAYGFRINLDGTVNKSQGWVKWTDSKGNVSWQYYNQSGMQYEEGIYIIDGKEYIFHETFLVK